MIYYPLSTLMLAGIREILIISTPHDIPNFERILGDGSHLGLSLSYATQPEPNGLAQAFIIGRDFIGDAPVTLVLGDNVFYAPELQEILNATANARAGATVFAYSVSDPQRYGVVELDPHGTPISIVEKPRRTKSNLAVTGIYFYDNQVVKIAAALKPSPRGELEITDVNREYLARGRLRVECLGRDVAWFDAGTPDSLATATEFVRQIETRQGLKIACIEETAYLMGYVSAAHLRKLGHSLPSDYGTYVLKVAARAARNQLVRKCSSANGNAPIRAHCR